MIKYWDRASRNQQVFGDIWSTFEQFIKFSDEEGILQVGFPDIFTTANNDQIDRNTAFPGGNKRDLERVVEKSNR